MGKLVFCIEDNYFNSSTFKLLKPVFESASGRYGKLQNEWHSLPVLCDYPAEEQRENIKLDLEEYFKNLGYSFKINVIEKPPTSAKSNYEYLFDCIEVIGETSELVHYKLKYT